MSDEPKPKTYNKIEKELLKNGFVEKEKIFRATIRQNSVLHVIPNARVFQSGNRIFITASEVNESNIL